MRTHLFTNEHPRSQDCIKTSDDLIMRLENPILFAWGILRRVGRNNSCSEKVHCSLARFVNHWHSYLKCGTMRVRKQYTDKVRKFKQTDLNCNKSIPARVNYCINNNYCCDAYVKISSSMNIGHLYVNYTRTNNYYLYSRFCEVNFKETKV